MSKFMETSQIISVPVKSVKKSCSICGKCYSNKSSLERHTILCEVLNRSNREKKIYEEEAGDMPSYKELVIIIQELTKKYSNLEKKVEEMQKYVQKTKAKINILQWLSETESIRPIIKFQDWFQNIIVNEKTIIFLTENTMYQTLEDIFCKNLPTESLRPICGFDQKNGALYICENLEPCTWVPLNREQFIRNLNRLHLKILNELLAWRDKNEELISNCDKMSEKYNKTMSKLMGINFTQEAVFSKIKCSLFGYLKKDIKGLLEYEIEF